MPGSEVCSERVVRCTQVLEPSSNSIKTLAGSGKPGLADGAGAAAQLSEPGGLCPGPGGTVLVADTNNSLVRCCCRKPCCLRPCSALHCLTLLSMNTHRGNALCPSFNWPEMLYTRPQQLHDALLLLI